MKRNSAILLATLLALSGASVFADHNSLYGDNTGRTLGGAHDNRIDNNTHSSANADTMDEAELMVQSLGGDAVYMQGGYPDTVTPGTGKK